MYLGNERRQEGVHAEDWRKTMSRRCCDENLKRGESIGVLYAYSKLVFSLQFYGDINAFMYFRTFPVLMQIVLSVTIEFM